MLTDQLVATGAKPFFVAAIHEAISVLSVHVGNERGQGIDQNLQLGFARAQAYLELVLRTDVHVHTREADDGAGVAQRCGVLSNPHLALARRPWPRETTTDSRCRRRVPRAPRPRVPRDRRRECQRRRPVSGLPGATIAPDAGV